MVDLNLETLEHFIVRAKQSAYVGSGPQLLPYRLGSKDFQFVEGDWAYHDSYIGESDFIGQEIVYYQQKSVWGMNYYGVILKPDTFTSAQAGEIIKQSLLQLYAQGRFLGSFENQVGPLTYFDENTGDVRSFQGKEYISDNDEVLYELLYHGGILRS